MRSNESLPNAMFREDSSFHTIATCEIDEKCAGGRGNIPGEIIRLVWSPWLDPLF